MVLLRSSRRVMILWATVVVLPLLAQEQPQNLPHKEEYNQEGCLNDLYAQELEQFQQKVYERNTHRFRKRGITTNYDVHIYIDTSYERRRTGGYNNNSAVIASLSAVVAAVKLEFNAAAPDWDVDITPTFTFFDGETPFDYGGSLSETLFNFYDWVDAQGFPGSDDTYVFYSGKYSNQGISFVGTLCFPGGAVVGFVQNEDPNEDLSAHEWMGHTCGSGHYSGQQNIMNPIAKRPWLAASLVVIEDFMDNSQTCVENIQIPLANEFDVFDVSRKNDFVAIHCRLYEEARKLEIQRKFEEQEWVSLQHVDHSLANHDYQWTDIPIFSGTYYYRIMAEDMDGSVTFSDIQVIDWKTNEWVVRYPYVSNPNRETLSFFHVTGRCLLKTSEEIIDLSELYGLGMIFIQGDGKTQKCIIP